MQPLRAAARDAGSAPAYRLAHMGRTARAFALLLLLGPSLPATCIEVAWLRLLSGEAEPLVWRGGEAWPERPGDFPFAPSAVLSYATLAPGDSMPEAELEARTLAWERMLAESGRFSRCSVFPVEGDGDPERRGVIVEAEAGAPPLFGGGPAYGSMVLPLLGGRRSSLAFEAGPNRGSIAYRDDALGDLPLVLAGRLDYANDLLETGAFSGHRASASLGIGPRIGALSDILLRAREAVPLGPGNEGTTSSFALGALLELAGLSLFGIPGLDGELALSGDAYPGSSARRSEAVSGLRARLGPATLSFSGGFGLSSKALDPRERFDLRAGDAFLRGPEGDAEAVEGFVLARADIDIAVLRLSPASWLHLSLGPFAFCEAVLAPLSAFSRPDGGLVGRAMGAAGGGLRLRLGPPIGVCADIGCAASDRGEVALVFSILSRSPK
jgi:hypothetical protein